MAEKYAMYVPSERDPESCHFKSVAGVECEECVPVLAPEGDDGVAFLAKAKALGLKLGSKAELEKAGELAKVGLLELHKKLQAKELAREKLREKSARLSARREAGMREDPFAMGSKAYDALVERIKKQLTEEGE